eukprot:g4222.t1
MPRASSRTKATTKGKKRTKSKSTPAKKRTKKTKNDSSAPSSPSSVTTVTTPLLGSIPIHYTKIFIDNQFVDSVSMETFAVEDPSTGKEICKVASSQSEDVDLAVAAARRAFAKNSEWRTMDASKRGYLLYRLADLIERDREYLAKLECLDNGKPLGEAFSMDLALVIKTFRYYAGWTDKIGGKTIPIDGPFFSYTRREPLGVVGQIIPWNFPAMMVAWKLAPALACGNCCVLKPAEQTPLTALYIAHLTREAGFPKGVINVVPGFGATAGAAISSHTGIAKVAFTGSTPVGRLVAVAAAQSNLKKVTLELGGKSPCIVFSDVHDIDMAVEQSHHAIFFNQGQCCCAGSRTYVQEEIYDEFVRKAVARARQRVAGDPMKFGVEHGPQVSKRQMMTVLSYIEKGKKEGATLQCGGVPLHSGSSGVNTNTATNFDQRLASGYFIEPTVFSNVTDDMTIAKEEIFGPVQSILKFRTVEEVVQRANDTCFGLAAGVFTSDINKALKVAHEVEAGSVWINCYDVLEAQAPFGGYKESGFGRELGEEGLRQYSEVKTVTVRLAQMSSK